MTKAIIVMLFLTPIISAQTPSSMGWEVGVFEDIVGSDAPPSPANPPTFLIVGSIPEKLLCSEVIDPPVRVRPQTNPVQITFGAAASLECRVDIPGFFAKIPPSKTKYRVRVRSWYLTPTGRQYGGWSISSDTFLKTR